MAKATRAQRQAVRAVLFKRKRFRRLMSDRWSIDVLMHLNEGDEGQPEWVIEATGRQGSGVREAVERCRRVAGAYREMRRELMDVDLPANDRRQLLLGLAEEAATWEARARTWAARSKPEVDAAADRIEVHARAAARAYAKVRSYLPSVDAFEDRVEALS